MISGIAGVQGYQALNLVNTEPSATQRVAESVQAKDTVSINPAVNMTDAEAHEILQEVSNEIGANQAGALSVHEGLDYNRVMALIGGLD